MVVLVPQTLVYSVRSWLLAVAKNVTLLIGVVFPNAKSWSCLGISQHSPAIRREGVGGVLMGCAERVLCLGLDTARNMTRDKEASSPQRLALDLHSTQLALEGEKSRADELHEELKRMRIELMRVKSSATRETDSRLHAEEALGESQERLQLALDAAGLALWDCRYPFREVYLSARWGELLGDIALEGSWSAADLAERLHPEEVGSLRKVLQSLLDGDIKRTSVQYRFKANGEWIWLEAHAMVAEVDRRGRVTRLMGTQANITERKQIEAKADRARVLAEQASRAKSEFLANISHEIRTPLNAIMGLNQLLLSSQQSEEHRQWLQLMEDSSQVLLNLLNDVLDFSRMEAGKLQLEYVTFPLGALFESVCKTYCEQARLKSVELELSLSPGLPSSVVGDPLRIRQVLTNLLSNAVKFTPSLGRVSIRVDVLRTEQSPNRLIFEVTDSGIGIAPERHEAMFEAFTQADTSTARRHGGSGLGLAICSTLVKKMGGSIRLASSPGEGSTFHVELPIQDAPLSQSDGHAAAPIAANTSAVPDVKLQNIRVIVAEDNAVNVRLMRDALGRAGCDVRIARNGEEAVRVWRDWAPDLMLMDVQMPGVSGLDATARIRQLERRMGRPSVPILAVTANAMAGDQEAYLSAGMSGYVSKPVELMKLFRAMSIAIQGGPSTKNAVGPHDEVRPGRNEAASVPANKRSGNLRETLVRRLKALQTSLVRQDSIAAQLELEALVVAFSELRAERALRICRGLDMARHASEWGLFARALPLLNEEIAALASTLDARLGGDV